MKKALRMDAAQKAPYQDELSINTTNEDVRSEGGDTVKVHQVTFEHANTGVNPLILNSNSQLTLAQPSNAANSPLGSTLALGPKLNY